MPLIPYGFLNLLQHHLKRNAKRANASDELRPTFFFGGVVQRSGLKLHVFDACKIGFFSYLVLLAYKLK